MPENRITSHPILPIPKSELIEFEWQQQSLKAKAGETIASALIANNINIFGHHYHLLGCIQIQLSFQ